MKKESIPFYYNKLTPSEQQLLHLCSILCNSDGFTTKRELRGVIGGIEKEYEHCCLYGLLNEEAYAVRCPKNVADFLTEKALALSLDEINPILFRLQEQVSLQKGMLEVRPFYEMSERMMDYALEHPEGIDYNLYGQLLINLARLHPVLGRCEQNIETLEDLGIVRAIKFAKQHIEEGTVLYVKLLCSLAYFYIQSFRYASAKELLDKALEFGRKLRDKDVIAVTHYTWGEYYANYGQYNLCLYNYYQAYTGTSDISLKSLASVKIAYHFFTVLNERYIGELWLKMLPPITATGYSEITLFIELINAIKQKDDLEQAELYLAKAQVNLSKVNDEAPLLGCVYSVRSKVLDDWGLDRESDEQYLAYARLQYRHFFSTNGAMVICGAAEAVRYIKLHALPSAEKIVKELRNVPLTILEPGYALSVKFELYHTSMMFYRETKDFSLSEMYHTMLLELAQNLIPDEETSDVLKEIVFGEELPESVSGEGALYYLANEQLQTMMENPEVPREEVLHQIQNLMLRFPHHELELEVVAASFMDSPIQTLHECVTKAAPHEKYSIAMSCAQSAAAMGFDASDLYDRVLATDGFKELNRNIQIKTLIEATLSFENAGLSSKAHSYWTEIESMAQGSPLMVDVLQAESQTYYDKGQFQKCIKCIDKALLVYQPEGELVDERLASLLSYQSTCFGNLGEYKKAYLLILEAEKNLNENSFNILFNKIYYALALNKKKEVRSLITRISGLATTEDETNSVEDLRRIFAMSPAARKAYFQGFTTMDE